MIKDTASKTFMNQALKAQASLFIYLFIYLFIHFPFIRDASEKGITRAAIRMSLIDKNRMAMLVGGRRQGFLQKIKLVNKLPRNARSIIMDNVVAPTAFSIFEW